MDKKTIDTLRVMLCGEIEDIAKKGKLSHETLDILKDLIETEKNLGKIEKQETEKEEKEEMKKMGGMSMDGGYSQRKYYIDADYQPYGQSYAQGGSYMDGNSYVRGGGGNSRAGGGGGNSRMGGMYDMGGSYAQGGGSYMYPMYEQPMYANARGYSRAQSPHELVEELKGLMQEATDPAVKTAISEAITKVEK